MPPIAHLAKEKHYNISSLLRKSAVSPVVLEPNLSFTFPLLTTKFYIPQVRPGYVARPRLIHLLDQGMRHRLTLISAPTGFGKTSLLADWCLTVRQRENTVCWLSLEKGENDPIRFFTYLVTALQTGFAGLGSGVLQLFDQLDPPPLEYALAGLINEIAALSLPVILALDDYHLIDNAAVHSGMTFFIEHLPPNAHIFISTRKDPPMPLARLRAQKNLFEMRSEDLRFTSQETRQFLETAAHIGLLPESINMLEKQIEGWAAGLQLVTLSLSKSSNPNQVLEQIALGHPYLFDYLVEEVLHQQPREVRDFLVTCAVLERLHAGLCNALLQSENQPAAASEMLAYLHKNNLFLISLDETHTWFRFHPVFGNVLKRYFDQNHPQRAAALHLAAAQWYEAHQLPLDAVSHLICAQQYPQAARVLHESAWDYLSANNQWTTVKYWIDKLPAEEKRQHPRLYLQYAYALLSLGELAAAEHYLTLAEQYLQASHDLTGLGELFAIRALLLRYESDAPRIQQFARQALEYLPPENRLQRSLAWNCLGIGHHLDGDIAKSENALREALRDGQLAQSQPSLATSRYLLGHVCLSKGNLQEAEMYFRETLGSPDNLGEYAPTSNTFEACFLLGKVYYEWNHLKRAIESLRTGIALSERIGSHRHASYGYVKLAHALFSAGSPQDADGAIELAELTARELDTESRILQSLAYKTWLRLRQNRIDEAEQWLNTYERRVRVGSFYDRQVESLVATRVYTALGEPRRALTLLSPLIQLARGAGRKGHLFELLALQSLALNLMGQPDPALEALKESLEIAAPAQYIRVFLDEGEPMAAMLRRLQDSSDRGPFIRQILQPAAPTEATPPPPVPARAAAEARVELLHNRYFEPLTQREIDVLHLVESLCSNQEIAERLVITPGTVKRHLHNIYTKLDVESRRQAVVRARSLGIL